MAHEITRTECSTLRTVNLQCRPLADGAVRIDATIHSPRQVEACRPPYATLFLYGRTEGHSPAEFRTMLQAAQRVLETAEAELARAQRSEPEETLNLQASKKKRIRKPKKVKR